MFSLGLLAVTVLAAEPRLACTSFTCSTDISADVCEAYERRFSNELSRTREVAVTTRSDVQQVLGLERQRQLLGCSDDEASSCATELAGALGVDGILTGTVTRTRSGYLVTMKVLRSKDGSQWASASERSQTEGALQDALDLIARRFINELTGRRPVSLFRPVMIVGATLGLAAAVSGGVLVGLSKTREALLKSDQPQTASELEMTAASGSLFQTAGYTLLSAGLPIFVVFAALALFVSPGDGLALVPSIGPSGATVSLRWSLP